VSSSRPRKHPDRPPFSQPPEPLLSSVLALLKVAREQHRSINRTQVAKLLYFADLRAVQDGGTPFTGATWRWRDYGPYDNALLRAEDSIVEADLAERRDSRGRIRHGPCTLRLVIDDLDDPLPTVQMEIIRQIVTEYGGKSATALRNLSYQTPPMIEAQAAGDREEILNLGRARRAKQAQELLARHQYRRSAQDTQVDDAGVEDDLMSEHEAMSALRHRATSKVLADE
jgi:uncharacterized phage-associated protein